jgi:hypothetical protein
VQLVVGSLWLCVHFVASFEVVRVIAALIMYKDWSYFKNVFKL